MFLFIPLKSKSQPFLPSRRSLQFSIITMNFECFRKRRKRFLHAQGVGTMVIHMTLKGTRDIASLETVHADFAVWFYNANESWRNRYTPYALYPSLNFVVKQYQAYQVYNIVRSISIWNIYESLYHRCKLLLTLAYT